jgi:hypothetical protein
MCAVKNGVFFQRNVSCVLPTNYGGYYQVAGFTDIKFKVKLQYSDEAMASFERPVSLGTAPSLKTVIAPDNPMPTSNFGACTSYMLATASASYIRSFSGNASSNTSYAAEYRQKSWAYTLMAYKTGASPDVTKFPTGPNTLPVIKLNGAFIDRDGAGM